jgi:hypothetical protein
VVSKQISPDGVIVRATRRSEDGGNSHHDTGAREDPVPPSA